jgi:CRISPR-associated protein Cmr4
VGVVDLPIAREKATGIPYLPGSSLKGTLREACPEAIRKKVFGPDTHQAAEHAGSVQFSDQRLLLLPVRSLAGTFAWATSPYLLHRLTRDVQGVNADEALPDVPVPPHTRCLVPGDGCQITVKDKVILEDLDLEWGTDNDTSKWATWLGEKVFPNNPVWQGMLTSRLAVMHDDVLNFLLNTATEVTARIKLLEGLKTVKKGGLWYEEALPTETILSGLVVATPIMATEQEVFSTVTGLSSRPLQLGGKATVGRGLCRLRMAGLAGGG